MVLKNVLQFFSKPSKDPQPVQKETDDVLTFYHFSEQLNSADSFIKEGAKPTGKGVGGQTDGFYCWTKKGGLYLRLLALKKDKGLLVCVQANKKNFTYPLWQLDTEDHMGGLFKNIQKYASFLEKKATHLNIETPDNILVNMKTITDFQYSRQNYLSYYQDNIIVHGRSQTGEPSQYALPLYNSNPDKTGWTNGTLDAGLRQLFVDYLCQNCPEFKEEYNNHMHECLQKRTAYAIKYTGTQPL
ncbi:MAG: hypothetical protein IKY98_00135, partial [Alphaproteobacteria bacterium]|nr:hypothetical protein [Alphaproteobacteria bacterium]